MNNKERRVRPQSRQQFRFRRQARVVDKKLERLYGTNRGPLAKGIDGRIMRNTEGKLELAVIIDEETTAEELREAWPGIVKVRTLLLEVQGTDMRKSKNALIYGHAQRKACGWTYADIARDINYDVLFHVCHGHLEFEESNESTAIGMAVVLLQTMHMKDNEILMWLEDGLHEIQEGRLPWSPDDGPVDWLRVRDALRQWERSAARSRMKNPPQLSTIPLEKLLAANPHLPRVLELIKRLENSG